MFPATTIFGMTPCVSGSTISSNPDLKEEVVPARTALVSRMADFRWLGFSGWVRPVGLGAPRSGHEIGPRPGLGR